LTSLPCLKEFQRVIEGSSQLRRSTFRERRPSAHNGDQHQNKQLTGVADEDGQAERIRTAIGRLIRHWLANSSASTASLAMALS
jgi:hypothetical protein